jgi:hypothetical protein
MMIAKIGASQQASKAAPTISVVGKRIELQAAQWENVAL